MDWKDLEFLLQTVKVVSIQCPVIEQPNLLKWLGEQLAIPRNLPLYVWNYGQEVFHCHSPNSVEVWDQFQPTTDCLTELLPFLQHYSGSGLFVIENLQYFLTVPQQADLGIGDRVSANYRYHSLKLADQLRSLFYYWQQKSLPQYLILLSTTQSELPPYLKNLIPELRKPLPTSEEILCITNEVLKEFNLTIDNLDIDALILAGSGLTYSEIKTGLRLGLKQSGGNGEKGLAFLLNYKINRLRHLNLEFIPKPEVSDFGGLDLLKKAFVELRNKYTQEARNCNLPLPKGCLLVGPPGTGKSRAAKACAAWLNFPLVMLDVGTLVAGGLKFLKEVLGRVEALAPCVMVFDEFDKLFAASTHSGEDMANRQVLGTLLTWLQEKKSSTYVIATLNRLKSLPPELTRAGRFDRKFYVGLPQAIERKEIIRLHALRYDSRYGEAEEPLSESEWRMLLTTATVNYSGSELEALVERAASQIFQKALLEKRQKIPTKTGDESMITLKINASDLIEAASTIHSLYSIDPDRILAIQNQSKYFCEPSSSPDTSQYAPPLQTFWGQTVSS